MTTPDRIHGATVRVWYDGTPFITLRLASRRTAERWAAAIRADRLRADNRTLTDLFAVTVHDGALPHERPFPPQEPPTDDTD